MDGIKESMTHPEDHPIQPVIDMRGVTASTSGSGSGGTDMTGDGGPPGGQGQMHYSIPGILHFLQHEWSRFEMERSQWEVEKAELHARIAFLQGERKGQENLKNDMVRRIKMLEYALKQERNKYNKLKYGNLPNLGTSANDTNSTAAHEGANEDASADGLLNLEGDTFIPVSNVEWRQGRQLLRQYLQEIGYTDTIIDVRSNRVRSLLGLNDNDYNTNEENRNNLANSINGDDGQSLARKTGVTAHGKSLTEEMMMDTEAAVMANFDFLSSEAEVDEDDEGDGDVDDGFNPGEMKMKAAKLAAAVNDSNDKDTEDVMNEFNFLTSNTNIDSDNMKTPGTEENSAENIELDTNTLASEWGIDVDEVKRLQELYTGSYKRQSKALKNVDYIHYQQGQRGSGSTSGSAVKTDKPDGADLGANLELGELEQLTITNDNESSYDITAPKETFRKTWNAKYTLRSHFDGVRALKFHPTESVLITASEDQTLKLWNLQKTVPAKKSASLDVEPVYTFRAHSGPVLSLAVAPQGDAIYSGGLDGTVRCWNMPNPNVDPYDSYDPSVLSTTLLGHEDAVWGLSFHGPKQQLLSCSSDGTVKLWKPSVKTQPLIKTFETLSSSTDEKSIALPTSVDWVLSDPNHMVTAYTNADCVIYDIETGKPIIKFDTESVEMGLITKVLSHPTLPLTITAHEDRQIRFFDNSSGKLTHAMVAHLDAVTSLSIDTNGLYLLSGSHDCSIRLWNLETKTCIQEITAHRKKFEESIFDVAFHPSKPFIASAGADALAKVFV